MKLQICLGLLLKLVNDVLAKLLHV